MGKSSWKQRLQEASPPPPPENVQKMPLKKMLLTAFQIFAQKYLQLVVPFILFAAIMAVVKLFITPDLYWNFYNVDEFFRHLVYKQALDPTYALTAQESIIYNMATQYYWFTQILVGFLDAIPQYFGILTTVLIVERTYKKIAKGKKDRPFGALLSESFTRPFRGGKAASAIVVPLLLSLLVPLGLTFLLLPGFLVLIYMMFSLQVVNFESFSTVNVLRAGVDHARKQFLKILGIIFLGFICTYGWDVLRSFTLNALWPAPTTASYNPATRDLGVVFLYFLVQNVWMTLIYPLISSLYTMLYLQIKTEKPKPEAKPTLAEVTDEEVNNIIARRTQQMRYCPHCGRATPVHIKACIHCKRLIKRQEKSYSR